MFELLLTTIWLWWIYEVDDHELICSVETRPGYYPTEAQLIEACPYDPNMGLYLGEIAMDKFVINRDDTPAAPFCQPPSVPTGTGLFETPPSAEGLYTDDELLLLSERLSWYDRNETPTEWQNKFDFEIWTGAKIYGIPATLLKRLIGVESQYWPLWKGSSDEVGLMQITDSGADVLMRYDAETFEQYCAKAVFFKSCEKGYHVLTESQQRLIRDVFRADLICHGCSIQQAVEHERANVLIYARVLGAYGCRNGWDWVEALRDYNGGTKYLIHFGLGG